MSLAHDLLAQSGVIAALDKKRPKQASLRRAVSTAYYALFHLLIGDASTRISPPQPRAIAPRVARAFSHSDMKHLCQSVGGTLPTALKELVPQGFSSRLRIVAAAFVVLQEERHKADYDLTASYTRGEVESLIAKVSDAFEAWAEVKDAAEANVFLTALLLHGRWSK